ncbi:hypothetical protein [Nannocystis pusilla]|uniref:Uncharacterized protein n=1 Tax=Nannocystis pusilla TaxID=889268 RepID=A0ABS7TWL3_9BACT|nr:hypothetical protein [Nannocystis pusilla]MBZ5712593.1 hypothetical protein [Nannocystis pusilla]
MVVVVPVGVPVVGTPVIVALFEPPVSVSVADIDPPSVTVLPIVCVEGVPVIVTVDDWVDSPV